MRKQYLHFAMGAERGLLGLAPVFVLSEIFTQIGYLF